MHTDPWEVVESRTSWLFLTAGVLLTIHAAIRAVRMFTNWQTPTDVFAPAGHLLAFVGLLGLARIVTARSSSRWILLATPVALAMLGWTGLVIVQGSAMLGFRPEEIPAWFGPFLLGVLMMGILAFALVALACVRSQTVATRVGGLLTAPAGLFAMLILSVAIESPVVSGFVIGSGFVLAYVTTGYTLFADGGAVTQVPTGDVPSS